ncbi:MAG: HAD-IA family hydrolase [Dehalococcoidia bacterium]|nr:HAD-IA family hydrolase [Dehalococcoidia bacterium]
MKTKVVILDAMGVMYSVGDDVKDLLCPFIADKGGTNDIDKIASLYMAASLGNMTSNEFWQAAGVDPNLEDEYLQCHKLTEGLIEFIDAINSRGWGVWCLSNDLSEWARKLRDRFKLGRYIRGFVISGDVGYRKPGPAIFQHLLKRIEVNAVDAVFVDDNLKNLDTANDLGFKTILFDASWENLSHSVHKSVRNFNELLHCLSQ